MDVDVLLDVPQYRVWKPAETRSGRAQVFQMEFAPFERQEMIFLMAVATLLVFWLHKLAPIAAMHPGGVLCRISQRNIRSCRPALPLPGCCAAASSEVAPGSTTGQESLMEVLYEGFRRDGEFFMGVISCLLGSVAVSPLRSLNLACSR